MSSEHEAEQAQAGMRFAYADPPYLGCCGLYHHYHPTGLCWNYPATHRKLIARLAVEYPDGWALSCHTPSLVTLLPMCPSDVRIGAWVKPFHVYKKGVRPAYAWEPILYRGGRNTKHPPPEKGGKATTPKDFIACNITLKKRLTGAKPERVCEWILSLLNFQAGDSLDDLYPGTGVMGRAASDLSIPPDQRDPTSCPRCGEVCTYDGWGLVHADGLGIGSCSIIPPDKEAP